MKIIEICVSSDKLEVICDYEMWKFIAFDYYGYIAGIFKLDTILDRVFK